MTLALIKKAREGDVNAYRELMDSAHGKGTQSIDLMIDKPFVLTLTESDEADTKAD
jgi:hypothetical protein